MAQRSLPVAGVDESPRLISYVMDRDSGFAPNPFFGTCILSHCKFSATGKRPNVIESAAEGTWIVGTGGSKLNKRGRLIYAMRVAEKLPISRLFRLPEHAHRRKAFGYRRGCNEDEARHGKWMLTATEFYYFGEGAIKIPSYLNPPHAPPARKGGPESLEKRGPGYKSNFSASFVQKFETWIRLQKPGRRNLPHHLDPGTKMFLEEVGEL